MDKDSFDLVVIGGGINGAGIAADAAGRNLRVALIEAEDFASATSSASTKLIHGGLRYLEQCQFRLVKEALAEREILLKKAPFIIWPMRFRLPYSQQLRPIWLIRLGLFLYDSLAQRKKLSKSRYLKFTQADNLQPQFSHGFEYSDCWVDDARLVITNVIAAAEHGARVQNHHRLVSARRAENHWQLEIHNNLTNQRVFYQAKALVNAAGPWVAQILTGCLAQPSPQQVRLIKGSHIVVKKAKPAPCAYILQHSDKRIVFAIPYLGEFMMVGTTDVDYQGNANQVHIDPQEIDYLLGVYNHYFTQQLTAEDIVHSFSGVRPLYGDDTDTSPQHLSRDYHIELDDQQGLPVISVFGGKITTYRIVAETVVNQLYSYFPSMSQAWTAGSPLPGGEGIGSYLEVEQLLVTRFAIEPKVAHRLATSYGSRVWEWLTQTQDYQDEFGYGLSRAEVDYLINNEFVTTSADLLWRRTKLGLLLTQAQQQRVADYIKAKITGISI